MVAFWQGRQRLHSSRAEIKWCGSGLLRGQRATHGRVTCSPPVSTRTMRGTLPCARFGTDVAVNRTSTAKPGARAAAMPATLANRLRPVAVVHSSPDFVRRVERLIPQPSFRAVARVFFARVAQQQLNEADDRRHREIRRIEPFTVPLRQPVGSCHGGFTGPRAPSPAADCCSFTK